MSRKKKKYRFDNLMVYKDYLMDINGVLAFILVFILILFSFVIFILIYSMETVISYQLFPAIIFVPLGFLYPFILFSYYYLCRIPSKRMIKNILKYDLISDMENTIQETSINDNILEFIKEIDIEIGEEHIQDNKFILHTRNYLILTRSQMIIPQYKVVRTEYVRKAGNRWNLYYDKITMIVHFENGKSYAFFLGEDRKDANELIDKYKAWGFN